MLEKQIRSLVSDYVLGKIGRKRFSETFVKLYFEVRNSAQPPEVRQLCSTLVGPFAELSGGYRSEKSFREELTRIASPFASFYDGQRVRTDERIAS